MNHEIDSLVDRAAAYGDGLFETVAIRDGEARFWALHYERLQTGCARLGLPCPDTQSLLATIADTLANAEIATAFASAKLIVTAGKSKRGYKRDPNADPVVSISLHTARKLPTEIYRSGATTRQCATQLAVQPLLAGIKSLNRLEQVLARAEWNDGEIFEGLMLDTNGRLICGTMSNVFIVKKSAVITPAITRCGVSGIMRRHLVGLLEDEQGIECEVRDIAATELNTADEVFLSNSQFGVVPVSKCGSIEWPVGPVTRRVQTLAAANGVPECVQ